MHFAPEEVDRVRRYWGAPRIITGEGMKAVALFEAVARGKIKALWVMGTNPLVSMPRADVIREALTGLDLYVVSEAVADSDTAQGLGKTTVLLPAQAWGEKDGTVTNSERRISRQRRFLKSPGEARPDWAVLAEVGRRLGHGRAFGFDSAAAIFREHAGLSAYENNGTRDFDLGALTDLSDAAYDVNLPVQWPIPKRSGPRGRPTGQGAPVRRRAVLHVRPARALRRRAAAGPRVGGVGGIPLRAQHRPGARSLAHDDPHG